MFAAVEGLTAMGEINSNRPAILEAEIVSLWYRGDDNPVSGRMRTSYTDPNSQEQPLLPLDITLTQGKFHRTRISIGALPLFLQGTYHFKVEFQTEGSDIWELAATLPLIIGVELIPHPPHP